jgi:hypothetical protein
VNVRVDVAVPLAAGVIDVGVNTALVPVGIPVVLKLTAELKPFALVTVMVLVPPVFCAIVSVVGEAAIVKLGGSVTVKAMVVVADKLPEVPVMVTVAVPVAAELLAVSVSTLVPVAGLVPNCAVTPLGRPEAASVTLPVNPFKGATVMVVVPLFP